MIVYVLVCYKYTDSCVVGVYRYKEKALFHQQKLQRECKEKYIYEVESYEVIL